MSDTTGQFADTESHIVMKQNVAIVISFYDKFVPVFTSQFLFNYEL